MICFWTGPSLDSSMTAELLRLMLTMRPHDKQRPQDVHTRISVMESHVYKRITLMSYKHILHHVHTLTS